MLSLVTDNHVEYTSVVVGKKTKKKTPDSVKHQSNKVLSLINLADNFNCSVLIVLEKKKKKCSDCFQIK